MNNIIFILILNKNETQNINFFKLFYILNHYIFKIKKSYLCHTIKYNFISKNLFFIVLNILTISYLIIICFNKL